MKFKNEEVTFLEWIDNVWYHYKAPIIIGFFAILLVSFASVQMLAKNEPDVFIYSVGDSALSAKGADEFKEDMQEKFAKDVNGDGKVVVDLKSDTFTMVETDDGKKYVYNPSNQMTETQRFNMELGMGECVVYIMEKGFFSPNLAYIAPLSEVLGYVPENAVHGKGMRLGDLVAYKSTKLFKNFPEDYIICLAAKRDRFDEEYYKGNAEFLKALIEYR